MKAYLVTTGSVFAIIVLVHIMRLMADGLYVAADPVWVVLTAAAAGLAIWAFRLLRLLSVARAP